MNVFQKHYDNYKIDRDRYRSQGMAFEAALLTRMMLISSERFGTVVSEGDLDMVADEVILLARLEAVEIRELEPSQENHSVWSNVLECLEDLHQTYCRTEHDDERRNAALFALMIAYDEWLD